MKYELETLETMAAECVFNPSLAELEEQKTLFIDEAWRTKKAIIHNLLLQKNQTLLHTYFTVHMQKLVELCDKVFEVVEQQVNHIIIFSILDLLGALKKAMPGLIDRNLALPKAFRVPC